MKIFIRTILLILVSLLGVSCAAGPGYGQGPRRGGPPMGGPGGHGGQQGQQSGIWSRSVRDYTHYRFWVDPVTGRVTRKNLGNVGHDDPGLQMYAAEKGMRILRPGETEVISAGQVPADILAKIAPLPRQGGNSRFGGVVPSRGGRPQGGYQPAPPCANGYCPPQGGPQGRQVPPAQYDSFGRIPQYVPTIPRGMKAWDAHRRGIW
jgi:hypothetical protein